MWPFLSSSSSSTSSSSASASVNVSASGAGSWPAEAPSSAPTASPTPAPAAGPPSSRIYAANASASAGPSAPFAPLLLPAHLIPAAPAPVPIPPPAFHPDTLRIPATAMCIGFVSGCFTSASRASMVFMAENAHRQPDTVQGWYFYNKTKNYKILLAGAKGGAGAALRLGAWAGSWVALDHAIAVCRRSILFGPAASATTPTFVQPRPPRTGSAGAAGDAVASGGSETEAQAARRKEVALARAYHPQDRYMRSFDGAFAGVGIASGAVLLHQLPRPTSYHFILGGLLAGGLAGALRDVQGLLAEANVLRDPTWSTTPIRSSAPASHLIPQ